MNGLLIILAVLMVIFVIMMIAMTISIIKLTRQIRQTQQNVEAISQRIANLNGIVSTVSIGVELAKSFALKSGFFSKFFSKKKVKRVKKSAKEQPNKLAKKVVRDNENGARRAILEDLFFDFHKSRHQVYWVNFVRGIFFGLGSALGATLLIAILIWILGQFADIFPPLADFINHLIETMQRRQ